MLALVLPALISDSRAVRAKAGLASLDWDTLLGVWYIWLGSGSTVLVTPLIGLAMLGLPQMLRREPLLQAACLGVVLTVLLILASQPQWVQHPVTMGRYLLPFMPLLMLASACGITGLANWSARSGALQMVVATALGAIMLFYVMSTPSWRLIARPNSQMTHSLLQFDFRPGHNRVEDYQREHLESSPFWVQLAAMPSDSLRIAVAPFYFETYNWDAPNWERASHQRVFPAYLNGYCLKKRFGEVPRNARFRFSNVFYLDGLTDAGMNRPDWLVYNRPFIGFSKGRDGQMVGEETLHCLEQLREQLGRPDYEDELLLAWNLGKSQARQRP
jgi:hypothetical protein